LLIIGISSSSYSKITYSSYTVTNHIQTQNYISPTYIYNIKVIQQKISASRPEEGEALNHPRKTTSSKSGHS
jgi:hypothetical protein